MSIVLPLNADGAIADYSSLVTEVAEWLDRDDLTTRIPGFIALVEAEINRLLRTKGQEIKTTWALTSNTYALPDDFQRMRKIHVDGAPDRELSQISPQGAYGYADSGNAIVYTIEGGIFTLYPAPTGSTSLNVTYWKKVPALTSSASTNWLLSEHPDVYLWGAIREGAAFVRDPDAIAYAGDRFASALAQLQDAARRDVWSGPLSPRSAVQVRGARC